MRNRMLFIVGWLLLCLTIPTLAQLSDDGTTFTFSNGLTLSIPDGWKAAEQDEKQSDFVAVDDGRTGLSLFVYYPETVQADGIETAVELIATHYKTVYKADVDHDQVKDVTLEGYDGVSYFNSVKTETDEYEQTAYAFLLPDGTGLLGLIYPMSGGGLRKTSEDDAVPLIENVLQGVADLPDTTHVDPTATPVIEINLPDIGPSGNNSDETNSTPADTSGGDEKVHDFGYRTTLTAPDGWMFEDNEGSSVKITDDSTKIEVAFYTPHRAGLKGRDAEDLLLDYFKTVNNAAANVVNPDKIDDIDIGDLEGVRYETLYSPSEGEEYELTVISVILPNDAGIVASIYPANGDRLEDQSSAVSVVEDFITSQPPAPDKIDLGYGIIFDVPRGWAVYNLGSSFVDLDNGAISITVRTYYPSVVKDERLDRSDDLLAYYMDGFYPDVPFRSRNAEDIDLGKLKGSRFSFDATDSNTTDAYPHVVIGTVLEDKQRVLIGEIIPVQGDRLVGEEETTSLFSDIANSIDDMPTDFTLMDDTVFELPKDWYYYNSTEDYLINVENDVTGFFLVMYAPDEIEGHATDAHEMLEFYHDEDIASRDLEDVEVSGIEGARYETTITNAAGETFDRIEYAFILPNGYSLVAGIYSLYGDKIKERDALPLLEDYLKQY